MHRKEVKRVNNQGKNRRDVHGKQVKLFDEEERKVREFSCIGVKIMA
jgi:hypothetical protein